MYQRRIEELTKRGRKAETQGELINVQIEIANIVASGLMRFAQPVTDVSAVPIVATLENYVRLIREQIPDEDFNARIAEFNALTTATATSIALPDDEEDA